MVCFSFDILCSSCGTIGPCPRPFDFVEIPWVAPVLTVTHHFHTDFANSQSVVPELLTSAEEAIRNSRESITKLSQVSSNQPYYKWNGMWSRQVQDTVFTILFCAYLGGFSKEGETKKSPLLTIEEVGELLQGTYCLIILLDWYDHADRCSPRKPQR